MKPVLLLAVAAAVLFTAPAFAQQQEGGNGGQAPPSPGEPQSGFTAQPSLSDSPFFNVPNSDFESRYGPRQCFSGRQIAGVNRSGETTMYVQGRSGAIFRMELEKACPSLTAAERLTIRAYGQDVVCAGSTAVLMVKTQTGKAQCRVNMVSRLTPTEVANLATSTAR